MNRAKQIRLDRGEPLNDVAAAAGIGRATLRKLEDGREVSVVSLARLATYYQVQPSSLLAPAVFDDPERSAA